jgi:hypothetical protein
MTDETLSIFRQDTRDLFYHGYTNYMRHGFPEDEVRPLSCKPQTRNRENPADIGVNDALGNYSLTLIDSLSTLAILASGQEDGQDGHNALHDFQDGVKALVDLYGDGSKGSCGSRACGFDLDSKVQVFETNIRGVGGLLSAHLFAIGELPIQGYELKWVQKMDGTRRVFWDHNRFIYTGQLLALAHDLASRLLAAFATNSGLPYPRVNLRSGIPFYQDAEDGVCRVDGTSRDSREITETCTAGAGSLVLEFTTLSRLTGDDRFERLAKKAFWSVWNRRSNIDLVGGGIDAESGQWIVPPLAGIGAGIDSFYEYALKSHILLSGLPPTNPEDESNIQDDPQGYLDVWTSSLSAISHHILRSSYTEKHPYYGQSDFVSGAPRYNWIDNLSAYFPGLLTLSGHLVEAIESHILFSALWTRYSALPERWHITPHGGFIDNNFKHWAGRPEFVESTWYLFRATKDPWLLHVGEMVLRDVRRRCWAKCGWASLRDVMAEGEDARGDRMESFFLGETAKYLYLLFDERHPLNGNEFDGVVFSTEGHPLVVPKMYRQRSKTRSKRTASTEGEATPQPTCDVPPSPLPLTVSNIAARDDLFHAAALTNLHNVPVNPARSSPLLEPSPHNAGISIEDVRSPTNYTFYPWTLPASLIPVKGSSSPIYIPVLTTLTFPDLTVSTSEDSSSKPGLIPVGAIQKMLDGVLINSLSNLRLNMVQEPRSIFMPDGEIAEVGSSFRVSGIANWALGRDEKVLLSGKAMDGLSEGADGGEHFRRVKDLEWVDLVLDVPELPQIEEHQGELSTENSTFEVLWDEVEKAARGLLDDLGIGVADAVLGEESSHSSTSSSEATASSPPQPTLERRLVPAILPTGPGAAPLPARLEHKDPLAINSGHLPIQKIFFLDSTLCSHTLSAAIAKQYQILVIRRGGCSFNDKLANIPAFPPDSSSLQLVIVLDDRDDGREGLIRPLLDVKQRTPAGLERRNLIAMVLVDGSERTESGLKSAAKGFGKYDEHAGSVVEGTRDVDGGGLVVKRRYWFESSGVPIGNLIQL